MASPAIWLEVLSWTKALFEAVTLGADIYKSYEQHKNERDTQQEARRVSTAYSTFSDEEVNALLERLKGCRDRFVKQGGGRERAACICSVLNEAIAGNGGTLPQIDDWKRIYATLKCGIASLPEQSRAHR